MAKQKGRSFLIKVESTPGGGTYATIGSLQTSSMTINNEQVDVSTKDSEFVQLLADAGLKSISLTGTFVADESTEQDLFEASLKEDTHLNYQIAYGSGPTTATGPFSVTGTLNGGNNDAATWDVTFASAGDITYA